ncbi:pentatricopeptide repeat-containing protein At1g71210 [Amborella trichopoda]|uniref:Pentacotripeptide-repeat region of PRORP domain-containing protein n=1 Tax=Amborella trichopoda TaxID=13333 RepID=W1PP50_AMBTC|nr:pentatricopeptide repeat-containing protein At1g71210 [Amborella trichopoda]XP_020526324.1 pentatricopeptide repeat-containing protein At1g71210 [Amborella trichopoda]XP_020526325.1 pentatricopeptide repeat-containing protein At1g71210 [Amborella trichopoda]XP_020526326.1 pentatricopeptide repeat-containing protein At1g71210 [Amborella trichopoda]ERN11777.1 hypothetical protein AMTR_s00022p00248730 [Amborella trichopoda]|eukprot:XP_020526323.1 pentatricopeptide repeat-containing protein At1g71210 [Amborella trichopoda]
MFSAYTRRGLLLKTRTPPSIFRALSLSPPSPLRSPHGQALSLVNVKDVASSFKDWFLERRRRYPPSLTHETLTLTLNHDVQRICEVLSRGDCGSETEAALSDLHVRLTDECVVRVLKLQKDVLPSLKFFDWAGRQAGYRHTGAAFHAIFKMLSRAKLMTVMLDWLETFTKQRSVYTFRLHDTLVIGYAVAGKPEIALQIFGKMRFQGLDLDGFAYNVLLNGLVEDNCFDAEDIIAKQIEMRGFRNGITFCISMKSLCKQNRLDEAMNLLLELLRNGNDVNEYMLTITVDALCRQRRFVEVEGLMEEFRDSGKISMSNAYNTWITHLVETGSIDSAMELFHDEKNVGFFSPWLRCYTVLITGLLRKDRLEEIYDLLVEMRLRGIFADRNTMNATVCFFCKAGMVDVAIELYNDRLEMGFCPSYLAYNSLINALCRDWRVDEAFRVLEDGLQGNYFPGKKTFFILADALYRSGDLDKMGKLVDAAIERNFLPSNAICVRYISALCKAGRVDEGYLLPAKLNKPDMFLRRSTYFDLIYGFCEKKRGDIASRLLLEMRENGHSPSRSLYRVVISCLCDMGHIEQVLNLLEMHVNGNLSDSEVENEIYNHFIDAAGHAGQPELARKVFEKMVEDGLRPNIHTNILMLHSYLKSKRIVTALNSFRELCECLEPSTKLYNVIIVGLCRADKTELALALWRDARERGLIPSLTCYEELVHMLCCSENYEMVIKVVKDFEETGRHVSIYMYNILLCHILKSQELIKAWLRSGVDGSQSGNSVLGRLVGAFPNIQSLEDHLQNFEELIERRIHANIVTYNVVLRSLCKAGRVEAACTLFSIMCRNGKKGCEPNPWTYDIVVHGLCKVGRLRDAKFFMEKMFEMNFYPTKGTIDLYRFLATRGQRVQQ